MTKKDKDKLLTVNRFNKPRFAQGVDRVNNNIFDGEFSSTIDKGWAPHLSTYSPLFASPYQRSPISIANDYLDIYGIHPSLNAGTSVRPNPFVLDKTKISLNSGYTLPQEPDYSRPINTGDWSLSAAVPFGTVSVSDLHKPAISPEELRKIKVVPDLESAVKAVGPLTKDMIKGGTTPVKKPGFNWKAAAPAIGSGIGMIGNHVISDGFNTETGTAIANAGNMIGQAVGMANPILGGIISAGSGLLGGFWNRGFGVDVDKKKEAAVKSNIAAAINTGNELAQATDNQAVINAAGNMVSGVNTNVARNGLFNHKGDEINADYEKKQNSALAGQVQGLAMGADNADSIQGNNAQRYNTIAFGGPLDSLMYNSDNMGAIEYGLLLDYVTGKNKQADMKNKMPGIAGIPNNSLAMGGDLDDFNIFRDGGKKGNNYISRRIAAARDAYDEAVTQTRAKILGSYLGPELVVTGKDKSKSKGWLAPSTGKYYPTRDEAIKAEAAAMERHKYMDIMQIGEESKNSPGAKLADHVLNGPTTTAIHDQLQNREKQLQQRDKAIQRANKNTPKVTYNATAELQDNLYKIGAFNGVSGKGGKVSYEKAVDGIKGKMTKAAIAKARSMGYIVDEETGAISRISASENLDGDSQAANLQAILDHKKRLKVKDPYMVIDKNGYTASLYKNGDELVATFPITKGRNSGDGMMAEDASAYAEVPATTGAGVFTGQWAPTSPYLENAPMYFLNSDEKHPGMRQAVHSPANARDRLQPFYNESLSKDVSYGCVSLLPEPLKKLYGDKLLNNNDSVYILPEDPQNRMIEKNGKLQMEWGSGNPKTYKDGRGQIRSYHYNNRKAYGGLLNDSTLFELGGDLPETKIVEPNSSIMVNKPLTRERIAPQTNYTADERMWAGVYQNTNGDYYVFDKNKKKVPISTEEANRRTSEKLGSYRRVQAVRDMRNKYGPWYTEYALGGDIQTHGADFTTGLASIDAGGSHEENPYDGVQVGVDSQGTPNLVEEGETIFNDYVFSKRIELDDQAKERFHVSKKRDITYAEMSKKLEKESSERPNDPISQAALKMQMEDLQEEQERQKAEMQAEEAREAFENMSPEEQVALMQQAEDQDQQAAEEEAAMQEQAMAEQQMQGQPSEEEMMQQQMMAQQGGMPMQGMVPPETMMSAYGGPLNEFALGGNLFDGISGSSNLKGGGSGGGVRGMTEEQMVAAILNRHNQQPTTVIGKFLEDPIGYLAGDQIDAIVNYLSKLSKPQVQKFFNTDIGRGVAKAIVYMDDLTTVDMSKFTPEQRLRMQGRQEAGKSGVFRQVSKRISPAVRGLANEARRAISMSQKAARRAPTGVSASAGVQAKPLTAGQQAARQGFKPLTSRAARAQQEIQEGMARRAASQQTAGRGSLSGTFNNAMREAEEASANFANKARFTKSGKIRRPGGRQSTPKPGTLAGSSYNFGTGAKVTAGLIGAGTAVGLGATAFNNGEATGLNEYVADQTGQYLTGKTKYTVEDFYDRTMLPPEYRSELINMMKLAAKHRGLDPNKPMSAEFLGQVAHNLLYNQASRAHLDAWRAGKEKAMTLSSLPSHGGRGKSQTAAGVAVSQSGSSSSSTPRVTRAANGKWYSPSTGRYYVNRSLALTAERQAAKRGQSAPLATPTAGGDTLIATAPSGGGGYSAPVSSGGTTVAAPTAGVSYVPITDQNGNIQAYTAVPQQSAQAAAQTTAASATPTIAPYSVDSLRNQILGALGVSTASELQDWASKNNVTGFDNYDAIDWENLTSNQSFMDALNKGNSALAHAIANNYDFGKYIPVGNKGEIQSINVGNWDTSGSGNNLDNFWKGWEGSEDAMWKEATDPNNPLIRKGMTLEQIQNGLMKTKAWQDTTNWLKNSPDNMLAYLQAIEDSAAPKSAKDHYKNWVMKGADGKLSWKEGYTPNYDEIFNKVRTTFPGTYWHTHTGALRNPTTVNWVQKEDGTWDRVIGDVGSDWKKVNTYSWYGQGDDNNNYTYNYYTNPALAKASAQKKADEAAAKEYEPVLKPEWPRYAGLFGPAVGLGMMAAGIGRPDTSQLDAVLDAYNRKGARFADYKPIGNYLAYKPMDIWANQNRMDANARATDRAIANNAGPLGTRNAGLVANSYASQLGTGQLHRDALAYNDQLEQQVAGFNRGTDQFNAESYNRAALQNAQIANHDRGLTAQLGMQAAQQKMAADAGWYGSMYGNINNLFKGISDLGTENARHNMIARMAADNLFGTITDNQHIGQGYVRERAAEGGNLNRKKNKRRKGGLTI